MEKEEKEKYLISKGWSTVWHSNYWVSADLEYRGETLERAYEIQAKIERKN
ncbi:hypothetical protein [Chryseobacterium indologenes]|uniref:hypothetical protein n=1 Tax=Chryseobacterium indologenes TaxID=253 RepID=UPI003D345250